MNQRIRAALGAAVMAAGMICFMGGCSSSGRKMDPETVLATVYGQELCWQQVEPEFNRVAFQLSDTYDLKDPEMITMVQSIAMEQTITDLVVHKNAETLSLDAVTEEEQQKVRSDALEEWNLAVESYVKKHSPDVMEMSEGSDRDQAYREAWQAAARFYEEAGWTKEALTEARMQAVYYDKVKQAMSRDIQVTAEEIEQEYRNQARAQSSMCDENPEAYHAYCAYVQAEAMYCRQTGEQQLLPPVGYRPAGYRRVKVLLIPCSEDVMAPYLTKLYEYQGIPTYILSDEEKENRELSEYVRQAQGLYEQAYMKQFGRWNVADTATAQELTQAQDAVLASVQDIVTEVQENMAGGGEFDDCIAKYGVYSDGTGTDPEQDTLPVMTEGHAVSEAASRYMPYAEKMVAAAMEPQKIGQLSDPVVTPYGVVLFQYVGMAAEGPVTLSQAQREILGGILLRQKQDERYQKEVDQWLQEAEITYTGEIPSQAQLREQYGA